jgi:hypothetical protein
MVFFNLVFLLLINPDINTSVSLSAVSSLNKMLFPVALLFALSIGAYARHTYFSKTYRITFWLVQICNLALTLLYIYTIREQHL